MRQPGPTAPARGIFDETRPLWQVMALFLVPLVFSNILQSASGTVNAVFIGRLIGVDGLAAVSTLFPILFLLIGFLIGFSNGSTVLIGQAYGSKDDHKLKLVAGTSISATFLLGVLSTAIGIIFAKDILHLLGTPPNILADAIAYAHVIFAMLPLLFVFFAYISFMRGTGDSTTPFIFLLLTTILSVLFTPALILGWFGLPHLGVVSAAWAGLAANTLGLIALIIYLRAIKHPLALDAETIHDLKINWPIFVQMVRIGVPTGIQVIMVSLAELAVISFVNRFGSHATAAYGAVNQIVSYVQFPAISIGITASNLRLASHRRQPRRPARQGRPLRRRPELHHRRHAHRALLYLQTRDRRVVPHRPSNARSRGTAARDHALELPALRQCCDSLGHHARQRHRHHPHFDQHRRHLGRRSAGRLLPVASHRHRRHLDRLPGRLRRLPDRAVASTISSCGSAHATSV